MSIVRFYWFGSQQPEGNFFDKYHSGNPIVQSIMNGFFSAYERMLRSISYENVLEAGCGEGMVSDFIYQLNPVNITGFDIAQSVVDIARAHAPYINFHTGSIYEIENSDREFDLVVASEVLEHLENPADALKELMRVSRKNIIISVPNEPIWRVLNCCRGKYLRDLGNTPGHIQHWSKKQFINFVSNTVNGQFEIEQVQSPLPWTALLLKRVAD